MTLSQVSLTAGTSDISGLLRTTIISFLKFFTKRKTIFLFQEVYKLNCTKKRSRMLSLYHSPSSVPSVPISRINFPSKCPTALTHLKSPLQTVSENPAQSSRADGSGQEKRFDSADYQQMMSQGVSNYSSTGSKTLRKHLETQTLLQTRMDF